MSLHRLTQQLENLLKKFTAQKSSIVTATSFVAAFVLLASACSSAVDISETDTSESSTQVDALPSDDATSASGNPRAGGPPANDIVEDTTVDSSAIDPSKVGSLTDSSFLTDYELIDENTNSSVQVSLSEDARVMEANGLPNHATGDFPNAGNPNTISAQEISASFPLEPTYTGAQTFAREPGVSINGVKFEPETAERATCDNNIVYSIEAKQDTVDLGLDFNNAHVQPTGAYHYHGVSDSLVETLDSDQAVVHVGFAHDGYMIYYSPSGQYKPSWRIKTEDREGTNCTYTAGRSGEETTFAGPTPDGTFVEDHEFVQGEGDLDACNGIEIDGEYAYFLTDEYPYIPRCLNGEFASQGGGQGGPGDRQAPPQQ